MIVLVVLVALVALVALAVSARAKAQATLVALDCPCPGGDYYIITIIPAGKGAGAAMQTGVTGVFYHPLFSRESWPVMRDKFRHFPAAMEELLDLPQVKLIQPQEVPMGLLQKVHTDELLYGMQGKWYYRGALLSVGGCVEACEKVYAGELANAFVFDVAAGHHAGPAHAWGGTYISCSGPAVINLRQKFGPLKVAIIDTDCHHGDGTRGVFRGDPLTLHSCFCSHSDSEEEGTKFCVPVGWRCTDEEYLQMIREHFIPAAEKFQPQLIIHLLGHDTCRGDYGDRGLSTAFFPAAVRELKELAWRLCEGRLVVVTMGGARADLTSIIVPASIRVLAES